MKKIIIIVLCAVTSIAMLTADCGEFVPEPEMNHFVVIVDRSGSMSSGSSLEYAKFAIIKFIRSLQADDAVALISFDDRIDVSVDFSGSRSQIERAILDLTPRGGTRLYDAVASGARLLSGKSGKKVIVFLTDGKDNSSNFSENYLKQLNIGEGIFVYSIGLGNVDEDVLERLANATNGIYRKTDRPDDLVNIYPEIKNYHYSQIGNSANLGGYSITSIPNNQPVRIDGARRGNTPVKIDDMEPGQHLVEVEFDYGVWECTAEIKANYRNYIKARESDLPNDLIIATTPTRCAIFVDDSYAGYSSMIPGRMDTEAQLRITGLSMGSHTIKVIPMPDSEMMDDKAVEFPFSITNKPQFIDVNIFFHKYEVRDPVSGRSIEQVPIPGGFF